MSHAHKAGEDFGAEFAALFIETLYEKQHDGRKLRIQVKNNTNDKWKLVACEMNHGDTFLKKAPDVLEPGQIASLYVTATGWWTAAEATLLYKKFDEPDNSKYCCIVHFAVNPWSWNNPFDTGIPDGTGYISNEEPSVSTYRGYLWQDNRVKWPRIATWRDTTIGMGTQNENLYITVSERQ
jgi:hypothetical protein